MVSVTESETVSLTTSRQEFHQWLDWWWATKESVRAPEVVWRPCVHGVPLWFRTRFYAPSWLAMLRDAAGNPPHWDHWDYFQVLVQEPADNPLLVIAKPANNHEDSTLWDALTADLRALEAELKRRVPPSLNPYTAIAAGEAPGESVSTGQPAVYTKPQRRGRRRIELEYETVQRMWWELVEAYEKLGEPRDPAQADLCDRLTADGLRIKKRTLQSRIDEWRREGKIWPPPMPTD